MPQRPDVVFIAFIRVFLGGGVALVGLARPLDVSGNFLEPFQHRDQAARFGLVALSDCLRMREAHLPRESDEPGFVAEKRFRIFKILEGQAYRGRRQARVFYRLKVFLLLSF